MKSFDEASGLVRINAFILALFYERLDLVNYMIQKMPINLKKAITDPVTGSKVKLLIRLAKVLKKTKLFFFFWEEHPYLFDSTDLLDCI